jgi:ABC-type nitrate/sulfonate/bicarbonate transport system substrate-binding protein
MPLFRWRFFVILFCAAGFLPALLSAQTRSNFASSITSESMAAVWVAKERGLFKKYGLDVQYILMPRSPLAVAALVAGEIDVAVIGPGHLVNAATGGTDVIGIANFAQKLDYRLNTRPEIKKKEELRGKRIAISGPGSTSHLVSLLALQYLAIDPNGAKIAFLTIPGTSPASAGKRQRRRDDIKWFGGRCVRPKRLSGAVQLQRLRSDDAANHARHHASLGFE